MQRLCTGPGKAAAAYLQPAKTPGINKAQLSSGRQRGYQVSVAGRLCIRRCHQHASSHPQVHDPLALAAAVEGNQIKDDVLPDPPDLLDARSLQCPGNLAGGGFQRLGLPADPHGLNAVAGHAFVQPPGNGFDFWQFGHVSILTKTKTSSYSGQQFPTWSCPHPRN